MDFGTIPQWGSFMVAFAAFIMSGTALLRGQRDKQIEAQSRRQDGAEQRIDVLEGRVDRVESEIEHLPDKDTAHRLEMAVARLEGKMETMDERLKPVAAIAARVQDIALQKGV